MRQITIVLFSVFALMIDSCHSQKKSNSVAEHSSPQPDVIVFMVFHMERDSSGRTDLRLVSMTPANGKMKKESLNDNAATNRLIVEVYQNNKLQSSQNLEHPLYREVEVAEGNVLSSKALTLKEADFFFRIQKPANSGSLKIKEVLNDQEPVELKTLTL